MKAEEIVRRTIEEHELIRKGDRVVLGLSGGPDSLCLLHILCDLREELGFSLYAVHVNHMLRGEDADADMRWVGLHCRQVSVPLTIKVCDVASYAKKHRMSEEAAGRKVRYEAFLQKKQRLEEAAPGRVVIALAHNHDDQAETVLMRVIRGSGVHGLSAMDYCREDGIIRPLLDTPRTEIEAFCRSLELTPRIDKTNLSTEYTRNRIRLSLIPRIEKEFNPNLKDSLVRLADSAREDDRYLNSLAAREVNEFISGEADSLPLEMMQKLDPAIAKRVIRMMFAFAGLNADISAVHLNSLLAAVMRGTPALIQFPKGFTAEVAYERVFFKTPGEDPVIGKDMYKVKYTLCEFRDLPAFQDLGPNRCILDPEKVAALGGDLILRSRRPGDLIRPIGLGGTKKIQDYFTDAKIPKEKRDSIQLLCCGHNVLWIQGKAISEEVRLDMSSKLGLLFEIELLKRD